jgi:hypothetical protein
LELSAAWNSDNITRTDGISEGSYGIFTKTSDADRRWVGTIFTTATNATSDVAGKRLIWNLYNQEPQHVSYSATGSHSYNGTTREWGNTTNRAQFVCGEVQGIAPSVIGEQTPGASPAIAIIGVGLNNTTTIAYSYTTGPGAVAIGAPASTRARAGLNELVPTQSTASTGAATWSGATVTTTVMG